MTRKGTPGELAPASQRPPGRSSRARYHSAGAPNARCGSAASSGAPEALRLPITAQALEATGGSGASSPHRGSWASSAEVSPAPPTPAPREAISGRPRVVSVGHKSHSRSAESTRARPARSSSVRKLPESQSPITLPQRSECTGSHGSGRPSRRNSGAAKRPCCAMRAFTPSAYAASRSRVSESSAARSASARCRSPSVRVKRSSRSAGAPAISASRPSAPRRIACIWNMRSRACSQPRAKAASRSVCAVIRGIARSPKAMATGAERPGSRATSSRPAGRVHQARSSARAGTPTPTPTSPVRRRASQRAARRRRRITEERGAASHPQHARTTLHGKGVARQGRRAVGTPRDRHAAAAVRRRGGRGGAAAAPRGSPGWGSRAGRRPHNARRGGAANPRRP